MPAQIDIEPRRRGIVLAARQDQKRISEIESRIGSTQRIIAYKQKRLSGGTMTDAELADIDDINRTRLMLAAILVQARTLLADPSKTALDYVPVDNITLYGGDYTRPAFWTQTLWASEPEFEQLSSDFGKLTERTVIPTGTTGDQEIETALWQVNFAPGMNSLQIANPLIDAGTFVFTNVVTPNDDVTSIHAVCEDGVCTLYARPTQPTKEIAVQGWFV